MKHYRTLFFIPIVLFVCMCSRSPHLVDHSLSHYEKQKLDKLDELQQSIHKITCSAYYQNYQYAYPSLSDKSVTQESLLIGQNMTTNSVAGTGLNIYQDTRRMILLSCYHVFDFKDTVKTYYFDKNRNQTPYLQSLSIKLGQSILIFHKNGRNSRAILIASDPINDIALIEVQADEALLFESPFKGVFGDADKIRLGHEIYMLGFPKGFFMVTKGLASPSPMRNKILIDAPFNNGFSGGVAVAFNEDFSQYHYVGLANSVAYSSEMILTTPDNQTISEKDQNLPYTGDIYLKELKMINYGVTFVVKSNTIIDFLLREKTNLKYNLLLNIH